MTDSSPAIIFNIVDFPHPEGPKRTKKSSRSKENEMFCTTSDFWSYDFDMLFKEPLNNSLYAVPTRCISRHLSLIQVISAQNSHYFSAFLLRFLKRADYPYLRLWKVFVRRLQGRINWHRRTWRTADSRFSSARDTPFSYSRTDT